MQLFLLVLRQKYFEPAPAVPPTRIKISMDNELDMYEPTGASETTPIVIYLPGITGGTSEAMAFVRRVVERDWVGGVHFRRGHAGPLNKASFNLFGNAHDLRACILYLRERYPLRPIALVGNSAGTAILVRYLGVFGADARVKCAVCISAGYDISTDTGVWSRAGFKGTWLDNYLVRAIKSFFLEPNSALLRAHDAETYAQLERASSVMEFQRLASRFAHPEAQQPPWTEAEWLVETCPLRVAGGIRLPTLAINAVDDPICHNDFVERHAFGLPDTNDHLALVLTDVGSHCAFLDFDEQLKVDKYAERLALAFIDGVLRAPPAV